MDPKRGRPKTIAGEPASVSTWVSPSTAKAINAAAIKHDRPVSAIVRAVLDQYFSRENTKP